MNICYKISLESQGVHEKNLNPELGINRQIKCRKNLSKSFECYCNGNEIPFFCKKNIIQTFPVHRKWIISMRSESSDIPFKIVAYE